MILRRLATMFAFVAMLSTYAARPAYALLTLGTANPNQGTTAGGTVVDIVALDSITGTLGTVEFDGIPATNVQLVNLFTIRATAPAHAAGHVVVRVHIQLLGGLGLPIELTDTVTGGYDYVAPPVLTSLTPTSGPATGGTSVTVSGLNFRSGGPNSTTPGGMTVHFGPNLGTNVTLNTAAQLTVTTPPGPTGLVNVTITNGEGESATLNNAFTYVGSQSAPTLTSVTPSSGPQTGGVDILLTGTAFAPGAIVTMCGQQVVVLSNAPTAIHVITPACAPGPVTITVTNPDGGTATLVNGFTSVATSTPSIGSITPSSGPPSGGTPVTVNGIDFRAGATLTIGCGAATSVVVVNATTITGITPACPEGTANVVVTNPDTGTATLGGGFRFGSPLPTVGSVTPNSGSSNGGTSVTISGTNFGAGAAVTFGANPGTNTQVLNPTTLTTLTPPGAGAGAVTVTVQNTDGHTGSLPNGFTYTNTPNVCVGDSDCDGLPDSCELKFGLNPNSGVGDDGPDGDPDGDGKTNLQECTDGTNPRGFFKRYMAEGATGPFFDMEIEILNPTDQPAKVLLEYLPQLADPQFPHPSDFVLVPAHSRRTVNPEMNPAMTQSSFSTIVESDVQVIVERTMKWDATHYGSHAETSQPSAETTWYLAEGATHGSFNLFYLVQNPNDTDTTVEVTYLRPAPKTPLVRTYAVAAKSRLTIWVDAEGPEFEEEEFSAVFHSPQPIMVERSMYADAPGQTWAGGTSSAAVAALSPQWFFAEGATGSFFDTFFLIENPNATQETVRATYLLYTGDSFQKDYIVAGNTRFTLGINADDPRLSNTAFSTKFETLSGDGIIVERAMWWPASLPWIEGHNSAGVTSTGTEWAVAEGELGGPDKAETFVLVANTSPVAASIRVRAFADDDTTAERTFAVSPNTRFNLNMRDFFPALIGKRFGVTIESLGTLPAQITAEVSVYLSADGVTWSAGSNAQATRLK
jgi:hypothetical protein